MQWTDITKVLQPCSKGVAKVEHFEVDEIQSRMSAIRGREERVPAGKYARLYVGGCLMMSDTLMEKNSNFDLIWRATGDVLIAGLGLGMVLHPILANPKVRSVTVVEKFQDVIDLVAPSVQHEKMKIVCADIFEWKPAPGAQWDTIYFDIWPNITEDNLPEMATLHRRFARKLRVGGWMESWQRRALKAQRRRRRSSSARYW